MLLFYVCVLAGNNHNFVHWMKSYLWKALLVLVRCVGCCFFDRVLDGDPLLPPPPPLPPTVLLPLDGALPTQFEDLKSAEGERNCCESKSGVLCNVLVVVQ